MKIVKIVVVGAGVVGLSTAVCVAEVLPFCSVTLLADQLSPNTTSDVAAGIVFASEFPDVPLEKQRRWFKESFDHLLAIAQSEESSNAGVLLSSGWQIFKDVPADRNPFWSEYVLGFRIMSGRELKRFPDHKFGQAFTTIKCECSTYLPWLENRFIKAGGQILQKKVCCLEQLSLSYDMIVNCCGLGSRSLVGDEEVYPVRGQVLKLQAPWLQHFIRDGDSLTYIYPGTHSVTLGGTRQMGEWSLEVDQGDREGILERCIRLEPSLSWAQVLADRVGLRPGRRNPRVARELVQLGNRLVPVVHNYGHGGWGVTLSWGTALDALGLIRSWLYESPPKARL